MEFVSNVLGWLNELIRSTEFYVLGLIPWIITGIVCWKGYLPWGRFVAAGVSTLCILVPTGIAVWWTGQA